MLSFMIIWDLAVSLKNSWPLPELGHITPNVEWFSVVRPWEFSCCNDKNILCVCTTVVIRIHFVIVVDKYYKAMCEGMWVKFGVKCIVKRRGLHHCMNIIGPALQIPTSDLI